MNRVLRLPGDLRGRLSRPSIPFLLAMLLAVVPVRGEDESWREVYVASVGNRSIILDIRLMDRGSVIGYLSDTGLDGTFECRGAITADGVFTIDTDRDHPGQGDADAELTIEGKLDRGRGTMFTVIRRIGEPHGMSVELARVARFIESTRRVGSRSYRMLLPHVDRPGTDGDDRVNRAIADGVAADVELFAKERLGLDRGGNWMGSELSAIGSFDLAERELVSVSYGVMAYNTEGRPVRRNGEVTLAIEKGGIRRLKLTDIFRGDTASLRGIARLCIAELWRSRAGDRSRGPLAVRDEAADPPVSAADSISRLDRYAAEFVEAGYLNGFALRPSGAELTWFLRDGDPDAFVVIPYTHLAPYILPGGPLDRFVRSGD